MLPRYLSSGIALIFGVLFCGNVAAADEGKSLELADGASVAAEAGRLVLVTEGKRARTKPVKGVDPKGKVLLLETHRLAGEQEAIHARFPAEGGGVIAAVAVRRADQAKLKLIWQGRTGLKGELGERLGYEVRFEDLTGDGSPEIIVGQVYEAVRLCGAERLPLLYRKVYDPTSGKLRPVLAKRPDLTEAVDVSESQGDGRSSSILGAASPASASRTAGDRGDPLLLMPPGALVDGDPATAWFPVLLGSMEST